MTPPLLTPSEIADHVDVVADDAPRMRRRTERAAAMMAEQIRAALVAEARREEPKRSLRHVPGFVYSMEARDALCAFAAKLGGAS